MWGCLVARRPFRGCCADPQNLKRGQDHGVGCALSPDDRFVAIATSRSKEIKVFKVKGAKEGAQVSFATGHSRPITSLDWSYDGKVR